jgi:hypothetical protein
MQNVSLDLRHPVTNGKKSVQEDRRLPIPGQRHLLILVLAPEEPRTRRDDSEAEEEAMRYFDFGRTIELALYLCLARLGIEEKSLLLPPHPHSQFKSCQTTSHWSTSVSVTPSAVSTSSPKNSMPWKQTKKGCWDGILLRRAKAMLSKIFLSLSLSLSLSPQTTI